MEAVVNKINEMQKYIPCLKLLIKNLEHNPTKIEQVKKMKYLLEKLSTKDKSIKLETLVKCEDILMKVYGKEQLLSESAEGDNQNDTIVELDSEPEDIINDATDADTVMIVSNDQHNEIPVQDSEQLENGFAGTKQNKIADSVPPNIDASVVAKLPQENGGSLLDTTKMDIPSQERSLLTIISVRSESSSVPEPPSNAEDTGECDMEIDEELTSSNVSKVIDKQPSVGEKDASSGDKGSVLNKPSEIVDGANQKAKPGFVDLTSDDSDNDTSPVVYAAKPAQPTVTRVPPVKPAPIILNSIVARKKIPVMPALAIISPSKDPLEVNKSKVNDNQPTKIVTIDLDSDSEDESRQKSKPLTESSGQLKMPSPKFDKPMFTIASVQSISTMQAQHDKKRHIEGVLYKLVKAIQYTTYHTVPQKYNGQVRNYLDGFVRNLMYEKNRVNLCLQKLQKVLGIDMYKDVKRVIQSYCSEPVNDASLPAPSPFCHRIKVFPEKLQFVMRNLFFFDGGISVIGYQIYSLGNHKKANGAVKAHFNTSPKPNTGKPVQSQGSRQVVRKSTSIPSAVDSKVVFAETWKPPTLQTTAKRVEESRPEEDLLAPMKTQNISREDTTPPQKQKQRRRKRASSDDDDDDDDDDENYVPQEYISDPDDDNSESSTSGTRRTSLQRASKIRCQKYLELERTIDDETYIRATEANLAQALRGQPKTPKATQPSPSKSKAAPRSKKKREISLSDFNADDTNPDAANPNDDDEDSNSEDNVPAKRRRTDESQRADREPENENNDDYESSPEVDPEQAKSGKNIVRAYHCRSKYISRCVICTDKLHSKIRISHYVNNHPDREVILSRLTASDVMKLQSGAMSFAFLSASKGAVNTYVAHCIFCQGENCMSLRNWYEHYTRHTGEYGYQCSACLTRRSCLQQIKRHVNVECTKENPAAVKLFEVDPELNRIDAYVCLLCNYVQLFFDNIFKHLRTEHELLDISADTIASGTYQIVNLFQVDQRYDNNDCEENESVDTLQYIDENAQDDMSYMICNMLASGQVPTNVGADQETNHSMVESKSPIEDRFQSPETIIPEFVIMKPDAVQGQNTEDKTVAEKSDEEKVILTADEIKSVTITTTVDDTTVGIDEIQAESVTTIEDVEKKLPSTSEKVEDVENATNSFEASNESELVSSPKLQTIGDEIVNLSIEGANKMESNTSQILPEKQTTHVDDEQLETTKNLLESTNSDNESETSHVPSVRGEGSRDSSVVIINEQDESGSLECLTQSATEGVFKNIIDSMIESAKITLSSESSSELPEHTAIGVEIESELAEGASDSTDSGPQFLTSTTTNPDTESILITITEINEPMESDSQIEELVAAEQVSVVDGDVAEPSIVTIVIAESHIVAESGGEVLECVSGDPVSESCDPESVTIALSSEKTLVSDGENLLKNAVDDHIELQRQAEPDAPITDDLMDAEEIMRDPQVSERCDPESVAIGLSNEETLASDGENSLKEAVDDNIGLQKVDDNIDLQKPAADSTDEMMDVEEAIPDSKSKNEENTSLLAAEQCEKNEMKDLVKI